MSAREARNHCFSSGLNITIPINKDEIMFLAARGQTTDDLDHSPADFFAAGSSPAPQLVHHSVSFGED
jgi:hypothetical protein